ncbi:glycogenin glucosyltransferase [Ciborinia camelliae]|nr:glycogenin glucosyltransferase [Ciborinia camelliae]
MASQGEDVYATLLLTDTYLPGVLVLAHSLRDAGTTKKIAVLVTTDSVTSESMAELERNFDFVIPVDRVVNQTPANLDLMGRPDLHSTFTKITLWKQTQFRRIVYMDADMVALRAPDELFALPDPFSAAPDIGWPDIFNTGLMVLDPNMGDYYALEAMAHRGISFDGADQGLLNMHFKNTYNRLSFTYNVTPSAHYQYLPAFQHFQSSISAAHFIGTDKPWKVGRQASIGATPYHQMTGRWWAVYDKHYKQPVSLIPSATEEANVSQLDNGNSKGEAPLIIQYLVFGEFQPKTQEDQSQGAQCETFQDIPAIDDDVTITAEEPIHEITEPPLEKEEEAYDPPVQAKLDQSRNRTVSYSPWDASKAPPPQNSRPEASNFPATHYEMSNDATPFRAPSRYPDPPSNMYYEVPKTPKYQRPPPLFPWEANPPTPSRVFPEDSYDDTTVPETPVAGSVVATTEDERSMPATPTTPTMPVSADPWQSFARANAWDEVPEIERYIGNMTKNRKGNIQVLQGYGSGISQISSPGGIRRSMKLTDFPTELERPSLPVTPAPVRTQPSFWGEERDGQGALPPAEGVPAQQDWVSLFDEFNGTFDAFRSLFEDPKRLSIGPRSSTLFYDLKKLLNLFNRLLDDLKRFSLTPGQDPAAQLEMLARRQSDVLANKLDLTTREMPSRPLPYGSEPINQGPGGAIEEPSYHGPGAAWEKNESYSTRETPLPPSEEEKDVLET